jgi:hypothetical protein
LAVLTSVPSAALAPSTISLVAILRPTMVRTLEVL